MFNFLKKLFKKEIELAAGPSTKHGGARAFERFNKHGEREMVIIGEKEVLRGHMRSEVLHGRLGILKGFMKDGLKMLAACEKDMIPQENLKLPVRAFAEVCDIFIEADSLNDKWRMVKKSGCHFLEEDDAYCFRYQLFMMLMAKRMKQIRLSKADKYYFFSRHDLDYKKIIKHL